MIGQFLQLACESLGVTVGNVSPTSAIPAVKHGVSSLLVPHYVRLFCDYVPAVQRQWR